MTACTCTDAPNIAVKCFCHARADAVRHLAATRRAFLSEQNTHLWLHAYNKRLEGVPAELILLGAGAEVVEEARRHCA